ncbi:MAG: efflux RND transporter periplasmic adaptor subunit, partial [Candidatus Omnitrophica bacterium]|nr:efflux RND transporter periplasmic adaptor subunit [Candidatus Omnitrophota bacterium]
MTRRMFIIFILFSLIIGYQFSSGSCQVYAQHEGHQLYYCPMHPTYTSDRPGDCPICNMKLVKREEAKAAAGAAKEEAGFYISPEKQQLIGVKTEKVISRPLEKIIRTVGRVVFDPDLYKAQTEYIEAIKTLEKVQDSKEAGIISRAEALVDAAELKLKLSGLSQGQVEELASIKESDKSLLLSSLAIPRSWVYATIYEYELEGVKVAQEVTITAAAYPDKKFNGEVVAIDPVFDSM